MMREIVLHEPDYTYGTPILFKVFEEKRMSYPGCYALLFVALTYLDQTTGDRRAIIKKLDETTESVVNADKYGKEVFEMVFLQNLQNHLSHPLVFFVNNLSTVGKKIEAFWSDVVSKMFEEGWLQVGIQGVRAGMHAISITPLQRGFISRVGALLVEDKTVNDDEIRNTTDNLDLLLMSVSSHFISTPNLSNERIYKLVHTAGNLKNELYTICSVIDNDPESQVGK